MSNSSFIEGLLWTQIYTKRLTSTIAVNFHYHHPVKWIYSFFKIIFDVDIFTVLIEFVTILLLFYFLDFFGSQGTWDLSAPTKDQTLTLCIRRQSLINNYWIAREVHECILTILVLDMRKPRLKEKKWFPKVSLQVAQPRSKQNLFAAKPSSLNHYVRMSSQLYHSTLNF